MLEKIICIHFLVYFFVFFKELSYLNKSKMEDDENIDAFELLVRVLFDVVVVGVHVVLVDATVLPLL